MEKTNNLAVKRIPVTTEVWEALHGMRKPGQTYSDLIQERILLPDLEKASGEESFSLSDVEMMMSLKKKYARGAGRWTEAHSDDTQRIMRPE